MAPNNGLITVQMAGGWEVSVSENRIVLERTGAKRGPGRPAGKSATKKAGGGRKKKQRSRGQSFTAEDKAEAIRLYEELGVVSQVAEEMGSSSPTIKKVLEEAGIKTGRKKSKKAAAKKKSGKKKGKGGKKKSKKKSGKKKTTKKKTAPAS